MGRPIRVGLAAALMLAGGCTLDPAYHRAAAPVPAAWPQGAPYAPASAPDASPAGWRDTFLDLRLKALIDLALVNNRDLRVAVANIQAARAQYHVQRAALLPTINAQGGATLGRAVTATGVGGQVAGFDERLYSATVGFSAYELDLFGHARSLSKAALEQYLATEQARRATQITLVADVAADWLTLDADRALLKIALDTQASGAASLDLTQRRLAGGVASAVDVSEADTVVQQARADVARYTIQVAQDINALNLVVGATAPAELLPDGTAGGGAVADTPAGLRSEILLRRPDVLQAEATLRSANANIGAARAAFFPSVSLTASSGGTSVALSSLFSGAARTWSFAPTITLPIFAGGLNRANLDYAKAERDADLAQYEKAVQTAFREAADALAARGGIDEQVAAQQALADAAAKALRLSQARYQRGSDTYLNTLTAQRTLYSARQSLASAQLSRATSLVTLYKVLGGGVS